MTKHRPQLVYAALALTVLLPLLKPGFVLTLDMVFTPHIYPSDVTSSSYLFYVALHALNYVIPADILQKLVLFSILFLSGYGAFRFIKLYGNADEIGAYIGGGIYMINPYVYDRFMAGQFAVLLGYSMLPFFTAALLELVNIPNIRRSILLAIWLTLIGVLSVHTLGLATIILTVMLVVATIELRYQRSTLIAVLKHTAIAVVLFAAMSSLWLAPMALGRSMAAHEIAGFTSSDNQAFVTLGGSVLGRLANVLRLQGFWAERTHTYALPQSHLPGWGIVVIGLWVSVSIGIATTLRQRRKTIPLTFLICATAGTLAAIGLLQGLFSIAWLRGFREPDKFVGLLAFGYAFFAARGISSSLRYLQQLRRTLAYNTLLAGVLVMPVLLTPTMFWGFGGQLQPTQYPAGWAQIDHRLNADASTYKILYLPWHLYMYHRFADRIIMNPAPRYFRQQILASNDPEFMGAAPLTQDATIAFIGNQILPHAASRHNLGLVLSPLGAKYVLLAKENDFAKYSYLDRQHDLKMIVENANFKLYQNEAF